MSDTPYWYFSTPKVLAEQPAQQEPVAFTVAGEVRNWSEDFSKYQTQHYVRPVYTTPPAQQEPCKHERANDDALFGSVHSFCKHCHKEWTNDMEAQKP